MARSIIAEKQYRNKKANEERSTSWWTRKPNAVQQNKRVIPRHSILKTQADAQVSPIDKCLRNADTLRELMSGGKTRFLDFGDYQTLWWPSEIYTARSVKIFLAIDMSRAMCKMSKARDTRELVRK